MATTATVKWMDGMAMVAESGSGHGFIMDGAPANGGRNAGARPMEVVLMGLGGCTTFDVMSILKRRVSRSQTVWLNCRASVRMQSLRYTPQFMSTLRCTGST